MIMFLPSINKVLNKKKINMLSHKSIMMQRKHTMRQYINAKIRTKLTTPKMLLASETII